MRNRLDSTVHASLIPMHGFAHTPLERPLEPRILELTIHTFVSIPIGHNAPSVIAIWAFFVDLIEPESQPLKGTPPPLFSNSRPLVANFAYSITFLVMDPSKPRKLILERRSAARYKLQLPVIFHWEGSEAHIDGGFTYDVALDGVLIRSKTCPPIGTKVLVEVLLPSSDEQGLGLRIQCLGKVTRVRNDHGVMTFGVEGNFDDSHLNSEAYGAEHLGELQNNQCN